MSNKTALEKRIEERAKERFDIEFKELVRFICNHPIGSRLKISVGDSKESKIPLASYGINYGILNETCDKNESTQEYTNINVVRLELLNKYIKEETDNLLAKLDSIGYLFEQNK